ncbi:MAG: hypothetical protein JSW71_01195 [Gemmatimonadota bacterium]|nr:MAG: hypothetical protein JSW71_01195 [Gemmatimonadota bacterium]
MKARLATYLLLLISVSTGCDVTDPGADGDVEVSLRSPNETDGAALLELVGPVRNVVMLDHGRLLTHTAGDSTWVFVALETPGRIRFLVQLTPGGAVPSVSVIQVSDGDDRLRADLEDYSVRLR